MVFSLCWLLSCPLRLCAFLKCIFLKLYKTFQAHIHTDCCHLEIFLWMKQDYIWMWRKADTEIIGFWSLASLQEVTDGSLMDRCKSSNCWVCPDLKLRCLIKQLPFFSMISLYKNIYVEKPVCFVHLVYPSSQVFEVIKKRTFYMFYQSGFHGKRVSWLKFRMWEL